MGWILALGLLWGGCNMTNRSFVRDTLARLPSGDEINGEAVVEQGCGKTESRSMVVWRRKGKSEMLMAVEGQGELRVKDVGKVLEVKGNPQEWPQVRGSAAPELRVSGDGNRAWLVAKGQVVASFDYEGGVAIFGKTGQPAWAVGG